MRELSFKEIIANIKKGEVWENKENRVSRIYLNKDGKLMLEGDDAFSINDSTCIDLNSKYTLQRKQYYKYYTFEEAFKAYDEGRIIESCESGCKYSKDCYGLIDFKEIKGKWYINS